MKKNDIQIGTTVICASLLFLLAGSGCAHKKAKEDESASPAVDMTDYGSSDTGNALGLETVHFDYDSNMLSKDAQAVLRKDASILKDHGNISIQIEGHCDARGGIQYNIALGQRRADSVQHFLADQGIATSRLTTISYGKEKPLAMGDTEADYAKNRRANLAITKK
jgi:peptidoglycan-associated lipoprotein